MARICTGTVFWMTADAVTVTGGFLGGSGFLEQAGRKVINKIPRKEQIVAAAVFTDPEFTFITMVSPDRCFRPTKLYKDYTKKKDFSSFESLSVGIQKALKYKFVQHLRFNNAVVIQCH